MVFRKKASIANYSFGQQTIDAMQTQIQNGVTQSSAVIAGETNSIDSKITA